MAESFVRVPPDSDGKLIDTRQLTTAAGTVQRQRVEPIELDASNSYGEVSTVAPGATVVITSITAPADWRFRGIIGGGDTDGKFTVEYDSVVKYTKRTSIAEQFPDFILPEPDLVAEGTVVRLRVRNEGTVSGAFEGALLGV